VSFDDEVFRIAGSNVVFSWLDAAKLAREAGQSALLDVTQSATLDDLSFPNGAHLAEVEVDPQTGQSRSCAMSSSMISAIFSIPCWWRGRCMAAWFKGWGRP